MTKLFPSFILSVMLILFVKCNTGTRTGALQQNYIVETPILSPNVPQKYYILEKRHGGDVIIKQCGASSLITINDTLFEKQISYQLSGTIWYRIAKIDRSKEEKLILCNGEWIAPGYIDTAVRVKIDYKKTDFRTTRFIINKRGGYENSLDTVYTTTEPFLRAYKITESGCSLKAKDPDSVVVKLSWWGAYTVY